MKNTQKRTGLKALAVRLSVMLALLTVVGCVLTSCGGKTAATLTVNTEVISVASEENGNGMTQEELDTLANNIVKASDVTSLHEQLAAALRGYDMTAKDFDDNNLPEAQPDKAPEFARNVLKAHEVTTYESADRMTVADVQTLVDCFKTPVDTAAEEGFLFTVLHWVALGFEWMIDVPGFGSFILGTVYFAIAVEIILLPLAFYQQRNSRRQARLRPKEMAIRKKYAGRNDQQTMQKMNQEIQEMYQNEGFNPATSGCLPLLVSFPFVIALYYVVIDPLKYMFSCPAEVSTALNTFARTAKAAGGMGLDLQSRSGTIEILSHLKDTSVLEGLKDFQYFTNSSDVLDSVKSILGAHEIPSFELFGINFGLTPSLSDFNVLLVLPVLTFVVYYFSMKLTRKFSPQPMTTEGDKAQGCSNTIMDVSMPLMSAVFTFIVPGAVGLYWAIKSVFSTLKSWIMSKVMPLPQFTEADYKAAERELAGKDKAKPRRDAASDPNFKSLHHIDDDEYETDNDRPAVRKGPKMPYREDDEPAVVEEKTEDKAESKSSLIESAPLKQDKSSEKSDADKNNTDGEQ